MQCSALGATNCYWLSYFFGKGLVLRYFPDKLRQAQTHVGAVVFPSLAFGTISYLFSIGLIYNYGVVIGAYHFCLVICSLCASLNNLYRPFHACLDLFLRICLLRIGTVPQQVQTHEEHLTYYIIFLRITPFLPNWFINIVCPLIDVGAGPFFIGTFIGMHVFYGI